MTDNKKFCENPQCPFHQDKGGLNVVRLQVGNRLATARRVALENGKFLCTYCVGLHKSVEDAKRA